MERPIGTLPAMILALAVTAIAGCGVETYRERLPAPDLSIRLVAADGEDAEPLPRLSASGDAEILAVSRAVVVDADHIRHVRLLDSGDHGLVLVLDLDDFGRNRLEEASRENVGRRLAIVAGGHVVAAPTIRNPLTESEAYVVVPSDLLEPAFDAMGRGE